MLLVGFAGAPGERLKRAFSRRRVELERADTLTALRARIARVELDPPLVVYIALTLLAAQRDEVICELQRGLRAASCVALAPSLDGERAARVLGLGIPSLPLPRNLEVLVELAQKLATFAPRGASDVNGGSELARALETYSLLRGLSERQRRILGLYLDGGNDKAIAAACACSVATVYEHWRRMAKKAGGAQKGDVITDFHRFLADGAALSVSSGHLSESA